MNSISKRKRKLIFVGITLVAIGVTLTNILKESLKYFGILFIAVGGLLFILGVRRKA